MLRALNPGLIYCAVSGYGRDGPDADKGGFDLIAQGFAGLMSITGEPGGPPAKIGTPVDGHQRGHSRRARHRRRRMCATPDGRRARSSTPRCSKPASSRRTGTRRSSSPPARTRARWARRTCSPRLTRRSREGRLDQHRRREPGELGADREGARRAGAARRRPLHRQRGAHGEPRRAGRTCSARYLRRKPRPNGSPRSKRPACRRGRSQTIGEMLPIRRRWRATWSWRLDHPRRRHA